MAQNFAPEEVSGAVLVTEVATDLAAAHHRVTVVTCAPNYPPMAGYSPLSADSPACRPFPARRSTSWPAPAPCWPSAPGKASSAGWSKRPTVGLGGRHQRLRPARGVHSAPEGGSEPTGAAGGKRSGGVGTEILARALRRYDRAIVAQGPQNPAQCSMDGDMNAGVFAEWTERQGYRTIKTQSTYWYEAGPRVFQAFPYHWVVEPDERELSKVLRHAGGVCLRYSNPLGSPAGCVSYHAVCSRKGYDLCHLDKNTCKNVRRGLTNCAIEPIPLERLAIEGWDSRWIPASVRGGKADSRTEASSEPLGRPWGCLASRPGAPSLMAVWRLISWPSGWTTPLRCCCRPAVAIA